MYMLRKEESLMKRMALLRIFLVLYAIGAFLFSIYQFATDTTPLPAYAAPDVMHCKAFPGSVTQTQGETQFGSTSYIVLMWACGHLTPRQKYAITSDFLNASGCSDWSINGIDQADTSTPFTITTDRNGVFGVGVLAVGCLPGTYHLEAAHVGVGSHFTTSIKVS